MAKKTKDTLKSYFRTGLRPTQENFSDLIDAMVHSETDIFIAADQKVGIGTTSPKQKLDVQGAIQVGPLDNDANKTAGTIEFSSSKFRGFDGTNWKDLGGGGGASFWTKAGADPLSYNDEVSIPLDPNIPNKINLRLGSNSMGTKIEVFGKPGAGANPPTSIGIGSTDESKLIFHVSKQTLGDFLFMNDSPENTGAILMRLSNGGRLALGPNPPDLSIEATSNSRRQQPAIGCVSGTGPGKLFSYLMIDSSGTDTSGLYWSKTRNFRLASDVSIPANSTNPGTTQFFLNCKTDGTTEIPKLSAVGTVTAPSDIRLKKNTARFPEGLELIKRLDTIRYQYNEEGMSGSEPWHIGISAQNLQEVLPELVVPIQAEEPGQDPMLGIRSMELVYLAFNAVKELNAKVEHLENLLRNSGATEPTAHDTRRDQ